MPLLSAPGVFFEPLDTSSRRISVLRTDIAAFVGICDRGPLDTPLSVSSWEQFRSQFGDLIPNAFLPWSVKAFFENEGRQCWIVRVAAPEATTNTAGVQPIDRLSSIVANAAGFSAGAVVTLSQVSDTTTSAALQPADRLSSIVNTLSGFYQGAIVRVAQAGKPFTYVRVAAVDTIASRLIWSNPLDPAYSLVQPIAFRTSLQSDHLTKKVTGTTIAWTRAIEAGFDLSRPIALATGRSESTGDLLDWRSLPTLRVNAASAGAWGNRLRVSVARTSLRATRTTGSQPADRASSFVESVNGITAGSVMKIFQPGIAEEHRIATAVDPARRRITWSAPLSLLLDLTKPIDFESVEFTLTVYEGPHLREMFEGLTMRAQDQNRYAPAVVNKRSGRIRLTDLSSGSPLPESHPSAVSNALENGFLVLRGGRDGIAALRTSDFTGSTLTDQRLGLRTLELVDEASILAIPDILIEPIPPTEFAPPEPEPADPCFPPPFTVTGPPLPPAIVEQSATFTEDQIELVQRALIEHCEKLRDRVALIDPPDYRSANFGEIESWRRRYDSKYAALYFPWVFVYEPPSAGSRDIVRAIPPSGHVAGIYARSDLAAGVHKAPANEELRWAQDFTVDVSEELQSIFNPMGINALRSLGPRGLRVFGARTISSDPSWRYINVRRLMNMIEEALDQALQWTVFEPHTDFLRDQIAISTATFLEGLWQRGALAGRTRDEAFYVKCTAENNPPANVANGRLLAEVGVAPAIPAEYVVFRIGRTEDVLEISELGGTT